MVPGRRFFPFISGTIFGVWVAFFYVQTSEDTDVPEFLVMKQISPVSKLQVASDFERLGISQDSSVVEEMRKTTRVICAIVTTANNHDAKARHIRDTWGKHCNHVFFMSDEPDVFLPSVVLPVNGDYAHVWGKTKATFKYLHDHHFNDADWFMKAEDDSFYIMENLRYLLSNYSSQDPIWFGERFKDYNPFGFMYGGAGYVLSKAALQKFVNEALNETTGYYCKQSDEGRDDVEMGRCLHGAGVRPADSRDAFKRQRFHASTPNIRLNKVPNKRLEKISYYPPKYGEECCSPITISFHNIQWDEMHTLYFLVYRLRVWGVVNYFSRPDEK